MKLWKDEFDKYGRLWDMKKEFFTPEDITHISHKFTTRELVDMLLNDINYKYFVIALLRGRKDSELKELLPVFVSGWWITSEFPELLFQAEIPEMTEKLIQMAYYNFDGPSFFNNASIIEAIASAKSPNVLPMLHTNAREAEIDYAIVSMKALGKRSEMDEETQKLLLSFVSEGLKYQFGDAGHQKAYAALKILLEKNIVIPKLEDLLREQVKGLYKANLRQIRYCDLLVPLLIKVLPDEMKEFVFKCISPRTDTDLVQVLLSNLGVYEEKDTLGILQKVLTYEITSCRYAAVERLAVIPGIEVFEILHTQFYKENDKKVRNQILQILQSRKEEIM